jgi:hypothetical protein
MCCADSVSGYVEAMKIIEYPNESNASICVSKTGRGMKSVSVLRAYLGPVSLAPFTPPFVPAGYNEWIPVMDHPDWMSDEACLADFLGRHEPFDKAVLGLSEEPPRQVLAEPTPENIAKAEHSRSAAGKAERLPKLLAYRETLPPGKARSAVDREIANCRA